MNGYAFGKDENGKIIVCIPKEELLAAGLSCSGPCINRFYDKSKVTQLDPMIVQPRKKEDNGMVTGTDTTIDNSGDILGNLNSKGEKKSKRVKRGKVRRKLI